MTTQTELFPMSQLDIALAQAFLNHFEDEYEKRLKAVLFANDKLLDAQKLRDMAAANVQRHSALATAMDAAAHSHGRRRRHEGRRRSSRRWPRVLSRRRDGRSL